MGIIFSFRSAKQKQQIRRINNHVSHNRNELAKLLYTVDIQNAPTLTRDGPKLQLKSINDVSITRIRLMHKNIELNTDTLNN